MLRQVLAILRGEKIPEDCKIKAANNGTIVELKNLSSKSKSLRKAKSMNLNSQRMMVLTLAHQSQLTSGTVNLSLNLLMLKLMKRIYLFH